jgi:5-methylcytosine-specific restriction endonuclease McrBC regulatory subunit McrC
VKGKIEFENESEKFLPTNKKLFRELSELARESVKREMELTKLQLSLLDQKEILTNILEKIRERITQPYEGGCDVVYFDDVAKAFAEYGID